MTSPFHRLGANGRHSFLIALIERIDDVMGMVLMLRAPSRASA
jgi:hypothetical protein